MMIKLFETGAFLQKGKLVPANECGLSKEEGKKNTMAYDILQSHNTSGNPEKLKIKFDKIRIEIYLFTKITKIEFAHASYLCRVIKSARYYDNRKCKTRVI